MTHDDFTRRDFLAAGASLVGAAALGERGLDGLGRLGDLAQGGPADAPGLDDLPVPGDSRPRLTDRPFHWGASTSAYQVEGAWRADGKGESIWDAFVRREGVIQGGATGDVACDHYHRWQGDIGLMSELNLSSYRFSIAWTRVQPDGKGPVNDRGLAFYERLVDGLLEAGIRPVPTLYHFDLPAALEDDGGWPERDTAKRFAEYANLVARALGDRVRDWMLLNEPLIFLRNGYLNGSFAPGRTEPDAFLRATHVANLAQGLAFRAVKAEDGDARVGSGALVVPVEPATDAARDLAAAERAHGFLNRWFLDPALEGRYPAIFPDAPDGLPAALDVRDGDLETCRADLDFIGLNYYCRSIIRHADGGDYPGLDIAEQWGGDGDRRTDLDWEVWPEGLRDAATWLQDAYGRPLEVTENGAAYNIGPGPDGRIDDDRRIDFYRDHLAALAEAMERGADIRSFHAWSLMDNFEWAAGYEPRFGLIWVDFEDPARPRTIKASGRWYAGVAETDGPARAAGVDG